MPTIEYEGDRIECEEGDEFRQSLLDAGESPHNGASNYTIGCKPANGFTGPSR